MCKIALWVTWSAPKYFPSENPTSCQICLINHAVLVWCLVSQRKSLYLTHKASSEHRGPMQVSLTSFALFPFTSLLTHRIIALSSSPLSFTSSCGFSYNVICCHMPCGDLSALSPFVLLCLASVTHGLILQEKLPEAPSGVEIFRELCNL